MESMATETDGKAFVPERTGDLEAVFRQITEELQAQYLLGYLLKQSGLHGVALEIPSSTRLDESYVTSDVTKYTDQESFSDATSTKHGIGACGFEPQTPTVSR